MSNEVLVRQENGMGHLSLNRPKALNALNQAMCNELREALWNWQTNPQVQWVLLDHTEGRGFCAGGDIRMLAQSGAADGNEAAEFFRTEYQVNYLLFNYAKPTVAIMDGITMGGGVGLALPCSYRIATENTRFAMPETGIGLYPDVGGGWYLPRLEGNFGYFLALTGASIKGADCVHFGLATHYIQSDRLEELKASLRANPERIEQVLAEFASQPEATDLSQHREQLAKIFAPENAAEIPAQLAALDAPWANKLVAGMANKSALSEAVTLKLFADSLSKADFTDEMTQEFTIACNMVAQHDFREGVRAVIVDKDNQPGWQFATIDEVPDTLLNDIFTLNHSDPWSPYQ